MPRKSLVALSAQEWADLLLELPHDALKKELDTYKDKKNIGYAKDPVRFIEETLRLALSPSQKLMVESVRDHRMTVVEAGHSVGKTFISAAIVAWWLSTKKPATVITLAPTWIQVQNLLWRNIRTMSNNAALAGTVLEGKPEWKISSDVFGLGLSPRKAAKDQQAAQELATTVQGYHSENELVILDEAAGLPRMIFDAAGSLVSGENDKILAVGNPIAQNGPFWDATKSANWNHIRISCMDHPNIVSGENKIPGAVSRAWVEARAGECPEVPPGTPNAMHLPWLPDRWFLPTNIFMSKVLGIAPEESDDQLISLRWVVDAQQRIITNTEDEQVILGMDPARYGTADSVITARRGYNVLWNRRMHGQDTMMLANWIKGVMAETNAVACYIDTIGIGSGTYDVAKKVHGLPVFEVDFRKRARSSRKFANMRCECWWNMRDALQDGYLALPPNDELLAGDLTAVRVGYDDQGRLLLEEKEAIAKRLGRSPDAGDSLALTFGQPISSQEVTEMMSDNVTQLGGDAHPSKWAMAIVNSGYTSRWKRRRETEY